MARLREAREKASMRALEKIMTKPQLDPAGGRNAVLAMDCSRLAFDSPGLRGLLAAKIAKRPQLAGVFLILFRGDHYGLDFAKNPAAAWPVPDATVAMISGAPGKRLWAAPVAPRAHMAARRAALGRYSCAGRTALFDSPDLLFPHRDCHV